MKTFDSVPFDYEKRKKEVAEFEQLLAKKSVLKERKDILPFFRNRPHIAIFELATQASANGKKSK